MNQCPKCGTQNSEGTSYCKGCGNNLSIMHKNTENQSRQMYNFSQNTENQSQQMYNFAQNNNQYTSINEDELLDAYIGKNAEKIKNGKFSIPEFIFGPMYFIYRKLYLYGFIWYIINFILLFFLADISYFIIMMIELFFSIEFNKIYVKEAKKRVKNIIEENPNKTNEQLKEICKSKGGTTLAVPIIIGIIYIMYIIIYAILVAGLVSSIIGSIDSNVDNSLDTNYPSSEEKYELNKTFTLGNYSILVGNNIQYFKFTSNKSYSPNTLEGTTIIRIPVTIQNNSSTDKKINYTSVYLTDPNNTRLYDVGYECNEYMGIDDSITELDSLTAGETVNKYAYFQYSGDGIYTLKLSIISDDYFDDHTANVSFQLALK